jgi:thiamine-phosphate pyrophosphorylase
LITRVEKKGLLRALDANCNRVREGLRVAEDVARFILNDSPLYHRIKKLRHAVTRVEKNLFKSFEPRTLQRDVAQDLGRWTREKSEKKRTSALDLLAANLKRAQEALRSLEEFSKLLEHTSFREFKKIRYECYRIEETVF